MDRRIIDFENTPPPSVLAFACLLASHHRRRCCRWWKRNNKKDCVRALCWVASSFTRIIYCVRPGDLLLVWRRGLLCFQRVNLLLLRIQYDIFRTCRVEKFDRSGFITLTMVIWKCRSPSDLIKMRLKLFYASWMIKFYKSFSRLLVFVKAMKIRLSTSLVAIKNLSLHFSYDFYYTFCAVSIYSLLVTKRSVKLCWLLFLCSTH
jgi:hypothetical protein